MFSVIIPTHNRAPILKRMLGHLFTLDGITECEVIVVDDGSADATAAVLEEYRLKFPDLLDVLQGQHQRQIGLEGPQLAKNWSQAAGKLSPLCAASKSAADRPMLCKCSASGGPLSGRVIRSNRSPEWSASAVK